jgi:hypothetical protein
MTEFEKLFGGAIVSATIVASTSAFWWILNKISKLSERLHGRIDDQEQRFNARDEKFVRRDDFKEFREAQEKQLDKIDKKLDDIMKTQRGA